MAMKNFTVMIVGYLLMMVGGIVFIMAGMMEMGGAPALYGAVGIILVGAAMVFIPGRSEIPDLAREKGKDRVVYECPACGKDVPADAPRCPACREPFEVIEYECPTCSKLVDPLTIECDRCGEKFEELSGRTDEEVASGDEDFECPACGEVVGPTDPVCPGCGAEFEDVEDEAPEDEEKKGEDFECPACGTVVGETEPFCPGCGAEFEDDEVGDKGGPVSDDELLSDDDVPSPDARKPAGELPPGKDDTSGELDMGGDPLMDELLDDMPAGDGQEGGERAGDDDSLAFDDDDDEPLFGAGISDDLDLEFEDDAVIEDEGPAKKGPPPGAGKAPVGKRPKVKVKVKVSPKK